MWTEKGKNAIVTGAGSGIGKALALLLAQRGANVAITDIVPERLLCVANEIRALGVRAETYAVDHADEKAVEAFHKKFISDFGHVDIMCLNAGIAAAGPAENITDKDWTRTIGVNLWGPVYMVRKFLPKMIEKKSGGILITASVAGFMGLPGLAPYNTSKYGMVGFAETLHIEMAKHGIHVCALCPGIINTNIVSEADMCFDKGAVKNTKDKMVNFYATRGTDPARVARDGLKGLAKNRCVQPSPGHAWAMYYVKRFMPGLYWKISRFVWKRDLML